MKKSQKRRSRSGCTECRRRHRKCDETRPSCSSCRITGRECSYEVRLLWGGRPFRKSRFGDCLSQDPNLTRVPVSTSSDFSGRAFVYGSGCESSGQLSHPKATILTHSETTAGNQIIRNPDLLSWLHPTYRSLLDHFISSTTRALSCHKVVQQDFCAVLVPMALQTPYLLVALLSLAATHRVSLGIEQNLTELDLLSTTSLNQLQNVLSQPNFHLDDATIATTLTLCFTEIVSDGRSPGSWRLHLQGAAAMISEHLKTVKVPLDSLPSATSLLWRWYFSMETVSLLCGNLSVPPSSRAGLLIQDIFEHDEIDDLAGFPSSLVPIFKNINRLTMESGYTQNQPGNINATSTTQPSQPSNSIIDRCHQIINEINIMLLTAKVPRFRPNVDSTLTSVHRSDFTALDETYHHAALLQLYRRVLNLPSSNLLVQSSVGQIIRRISSMHFLDEACPGVAVLQPLFSAGCEAYQEADRENIRILLCRMGLRYGMGNVRSALGFLEDLWYMRDANSDSEGRVRWDKVMVEKGLDLLAY
ncbi:C6 finger domain-containing protein [Blastomyces dermatitidis ATCC 18188]|uniref:C6 finger domain-containing protein n=1 Tax=Ajellomyces dermatitidis (strain ATCC 18188 / CBS 674.68) TaxID=653446 RepID=F2TU88_AJEDA|nr:C6 finger domain-containing protein [Blastomyces dermatitidis ATCC 18188]